MADMSCANPANGTHIIVRGNLRNDTLKSVLQRVMKWAENDADLIEHHHGGPIAFVRIPPEVIAADHGQLVLVEGGEPVELAVDKSVWIEPTIFQVDGVNPNTLLEYEQKVKDFGPKGEPTDDSVVLKFTYDGKASDKVEPTGWVMRWREKAGEDKCEEQWNILDLAPWVRVVPFHGLRPDTEYEFTLQGIAQPGSTAVFTQSLEPVTVKTAKKGAKPSKPAPKPGEGGGEKPDDGGGQKPEPEEPKKPEPKPEPKKPAGK